MQLRYQLLQKPSELFGRDVEVYNNSYSFWVEFWENFWSNTEANGGDKIQEAELSDIFLRQKFVHVLSVGDQIVGMVLQSEFNLSLKATSRSNYFCHYPAKSFELLRSQLGISKLLTHEFLTVDSRWRKSATGFSLAPILMTLGALNLSEKKYDGSVAMSRNDLGVTKMCCQLGWRSEIPNIRYKNRFDCNMIALKAGAHIVPHSYLELCDTLWKSGIYDMASARDGDRNRDRARAA